mgnify:FL=1
MPHISVSEIETVARDALRAHGAEGDVAITMADAVAWAEARGNRVCGLYYLESYCLQLRSGRVDGAATPVVARPRAGLVHVNAANGFAQPAFLAARPEVAAAAREAGVASLSIRRMHTCTALGWFTEAIAREGLIAIAMTNASPVVAAPGGKRRVIGTNPVAFAAPDAAGGVAVAFDQSTTQVALGRITMAKAAGEAIPEGWALDAEGRPTTDPDAALAGSLAPAGGHKGWGLGVMVELLVAGLAGGRLSRDVAPLKAPEGDPHDLSLFMLVLDPSASDVFDARLSDLIAMVEGEGLGRLPGRGRVPAQTVEVPAALWEACRALAAP